MRRIKRAYKQFLTRSAVDSSILNQAKEEKNIIYGARSIQKQAGIFSRPTFDYDIFSNKPKKSAKRTERNLERVETGEQYYVKPAMHPGTFKVMNVGDDGKKMTKDDIGVVDYTTMPKPKPKSVLINGVMYRSIELEAKAKQKSLRDKNFAFRHKKDRDDLTRIELATGRKYK